jgi:hypothetical protein
MSLNLGGKEGPSAGGGLNAEAPVHRATGRWPGEERGGDPVACRRQVETGQQWHRQGAAPIGKGLGEVGGNLI